MSLSKTNQIELLEGIKEKVETDEWDIKTLRVEYGHVERFNHNTGQIEHHPSGEVEVIMSIEDKEVVKKAIQFKHKEVPPTIETY